MIYLPLLGGGIIGGNFMEWFYGFMALYLVLTVIKMLKGTKFKQLTPDSLEDLLKDKTQKRQFIDVRTSGEFSNQKIKGFKNIPVETLHARHKELDKELPIVLMCASGSRSLRAANMLSKYGFSDISHLKGGLLNYNRS